MSTLWTWVLMVVPCLLCKRKIKVEAPKGAKRVHGVCNKCLPDYNEARRLHDNWRRYENTN